MDKNENNNDNKIVNILQAEQSLKKSKGAKKGTASAGKVNDTNALTFTNGEPFSIAECNIVLYPMVGYQLIGLYITDTPTHIGLGYACTFEHLMTISSTIPAVEYAFHTWPISEDKITMTDNVFDAGILYVQKNPAVVTPYSIYAPDSPQELIKRYRQYIGIESISDLEDNKNE